MCGIAGIIGGNKYHQNAIISKLIGAIKHRGPDEGPTVVFNNMLSMAAVRLSIVDVKNGSQPMFNSFGNILAQNGEIYNHMELRKKMIDDGYKFFTDNDTETLLAGFTMYGPRFVEELDGIFAISYFDSLHDKLYLFRDRFGVKPLYFLKNGSSVLYSSEVKSFWRLNKSFDINKDYLIYNKVFNWSNVEQTIFQGIYPVQPSTYLEIDIQGNINSHRFESKLFSNYYYSDSVTFDDLVKNTRSNLIAAVRSQIPREVNWAVLLSGGVDSSVLAWIASNVTNNRIKTVSISSDEVETEDFKNARLVSKVLGTDHIEIRINSNEAINYYEDYLYSIEDLNHRFFYYYFVSKYLNGRVKVALCGEGADELYMGYPVYRSANQFTVDVKNRWERIKKIATSQLSKKIDEMINELNNDFDHLYKIMLDEQLPWFQLNPVDKCSMRFGIELRVPYLSLLHALPVMHYPKRYIFEGDIEKKILRTAFADSNLPTVNRKKFFAGTRTLPSFYEAITRLAKHEYLRLSNNYEFESNVLTDFELLSLDMLVRSMKNSKKIPLNCDVKFINLSTEFSNSRKKGFYGGV